jgi:hypothetical protein
MTNQTQDGGPAFPLNELNHVTGDICAQHFGLTVRDYFAAKAMQAIRTDVEFDLRHDPDQVADRAYELADAMLKARQA